MVDVPSYGTFDIDCAAGCDKVSRHVLGTSGAWRAEKTGRVVHTVAFCGAIGGADLCGLPGRDLRGTDFLSSRFRRIRLSAGVLSSGKFLAR